MTSGDSCGIVACMVSAWSWRAIVRRARASIVLVRHDRRRRGPPKKVMKISRQE